MRNMPSTDGPDLDTLLALFPPATSIQAAEPVAAEQVPEPYHRLLVHDQHMTVTVEAHHQARVNVVVLARRRDGDVYSRKILLSLESTGTIVQFGLVRIHLEFCSDGVKEAILEQRTPLGRILIEHDVLRRIEPTAFLHVTPGPEMMEWFKLATPDITYGRLAIIRCDDKPAIELLEIVAPERRIVQ